MNKHPTCAERVQSEYDKTLTTLHDLWTWHQENHDDDYHPEHETNLYEYGLEFSWVAPGTFTDQEHGYWRYLISYGGPSDEFRIYAPNKQELPWKIEYWFLDWFDGAHIVLANDDLAFMRELFACSQNAPTGHKSRRITSHEKE